MPLRARYRRRQGLEAPAGLTRGTFDVGGHTRTYWSAAAPTAAGPTAAGPSGGAPLLIVLHGAGGQGPGMAALSGLHQRGPAAGFFTVFPDGVARVWNDSRGAPRLRRREAVDDVAFLQTLVARLAADGRVRGDGVYLAGMSNGGLMSEHLARDGLLSVAGIALIAGQGTQTSRADTPRPKQVATVAVFAGTADPLVPYTGGPIGFARARRRGAPVGRGAAAPAEAVASDWAAANGIHGAPVAESVASGRVAARPGDLAVTRVTWKSDGRPPVVLYRIEGGGHTWPGGSQYLPARFIGAAARNVDATGLVLEQFRANEQAIP